MNSTVSGKLNVQSWTSPDHRSGWSYAVQAIQKLHNQNGVLFNGFLEESFCWPADTSDRNQLPYSKPWTGILHCPPNIPHWFEYHQSPEVIMQSPEWRESMQHCVGLFTLTDYLAKWMSRFVTVPISVLIHPTEMVRDKFSADAFRKNRMRSVILIGSWLRKFYSFYQLKSKLNKIHLTSKWSRRMMPIERAACGLELTESMLNSVTQVSTVSNSEYDRLLTRNVVFLNLYDCSANNVIIECIARETPVVVNKLPAVVEYLGRDYPLYFNCLDEASAILDDEKRLLSGNEYLKAMPKRKFTASHFRDSIVRSTVYQEICKL